MPELQNSVFISYRRKPASYIARAIFMDLKMHGYDVFMDVESIDQGEFGTIIQNQIKARPYFLLILTKGTVGRLEEPKDWLRLEIELAIAEKRKIIPLMIDDFKFNKTTKHYFTDKLAHVLNYQAVNIRHEDFDADLEKLRTRYLKPQILVATTPTPLSEQSEVERKIEEASAQPLPTKEELSAEDYFNRAYARDEKDYNGAIADYSEAIRLNPELAEAYNNRGEAYRLKDDFDGAIADYSEAIRLYPQLAEAYNNRGIARSDKGDLDGAIADYNEATRLNPQYANAYNNRGIARSDKGDLDGAIADYSEAIRLNPQFAKAYSNRGNPYKNKGDLDSAIANYNEAIRLNPQLAGAYINRGIAFYTKGDLNGSMSDFNEAIRLDPQNASAFNNLGVVYFSSANFDLALRNYQRAHELRPDSNTTVGGLAITQFALDQKDEAKRLWHTLLAKDARYKDADWVGKELNWKRPELIEAACKLIAEL